MLPPIIIPNKLQNVEYASFPLRVVASIIDFVIFFIIAIVFYLITGRGRFAQIILSLFFSATIIFFWLKYQATPGKLIFSIKIADENTLLKPSEKQIFKRYVLYATYTALQILFLALPFFLITSLLMIALVVMSLVIVASCLHILFSDKNQAWHDKLASTVVIHD